MPTDQAHPEALSSVSSAPSAPARPGWDSLLLALLVVARIRIDSLAEVAVLPLSLQDVQRHPILGQLLPAAGFRAMGDVSPAPGEPVALVLIALTLGFLGIYLVADLLTGSKWQQRLKWSALALILLTSVFLPTARMILLRQGSGPASYAHDGGVIQTESTIEFFLAGKNPYIEDYTATPMAEWGFSQYRTALYHYPYLPWSFIFSAPFYLFGQALGLYDQRFVYLLLLAIALALAPGLVKVQTPERTRRQLGLVALLGLNPMMGLDVLFGQNDVFVLSWIVFSLAAWRRWQRATDDNQKIPWRTISLILFGLACASKPTAWFLAPFYGLLLLPQRSMQTESIWRRLLRAIPAALIQAWPALLVFGLIVGPYLIWDFGAFYDDVWRWSSGQGETGYQIWGWGASNFVLALGLVADRFSQWPFGLLEILIAGPMLIWFLRRQVRDNTLANACWHYSVFLLFFFYGSRFLNENYLGYILAFLAIGYLAQDD